MGVEWRAHDQRLEREVAIKILPECFANDPERRSRFAADLPAATRDWAFRTGIETVMAPIFLSARVARAWGMGLGAHYLADRHDRATGDRGRAGRRPSSTS